MEKIDPQEVVGGNDLLVDFGSELLVIRVLGERPNLVVKSESLGSMNHPLRVVDLFPIAPLAGDQFVELLLFDLSGRLSLLISLLGGLLQGHGTHLSPSFLFTVEFGVDFQTKLRHYLVHVNIQVPTSKSNPGRRFRPKLSLCLVLIRITIDTSGATQEPRISLGEAEGVFAPLYTTCRKPLTSISAEDGYTFTTHLGDDVMESRIHRSWEKKNGGDELATCREP